MSIFQGSPISAPSYSTTSTETPKWMQDAIYNQIYQAQNIANRPYESYGLQTVAGASPDQQQAWNQVRGNQGQWAPAMQAAQQGTLNLAGSTGGGANAAKPFMQQASQLNGLTAASPYINSALNLNGAVAAQPAMQQQQELLGSLNYNAPTSTLQPYVEQGIQQSGLSTAQPYLQDASQSAASKVGEYMSPYQQNVMDTMAKQGARNLSENLLPGVSDAFVRSGQFGSSRMGEFGSRAVRDTQEAVLQQQGQLANQGYTQALGAAQTDLARQGQLASTAGGLGSAQQQAIMQGGQALSGAQQSGLQAAQAGASQYGQMAGTMGGLTQAQQQAMMAAGQNMGSLTQAQQQALLSMGQQAGSLANADLTRQQSAYGQLAGMAQQGQNMGITDSAALEAAGQAQQGQQQKQYDASYQQWQNRQLYPQQQMDWLSTQIRGMAPITPQTTTQNGYSAVGYSPSGLSQLASGLSLYKGLSPS